MPSNRARLLGLFVLIVCCVQQPLAQPDDSGLSAEQMVERLATPASVDDLELDAGTRGFAVVQAATLSFQAINFEFDSASLTASAKELLTTVAEAISSQRLAGQRFLVTGHTDAVGSEPYNLDLSQRRAAAVRAYLAELGIEQQRIDVVGLGETALVDIDEPSNARNRRVEISRVQ